MSIKCQWLSNNQKTEYTVTLLKPLYACSLEDFNRNAFAASYDQLNNVVYVGQPSQYATSDRSDAVWYTTGNSLDFRDLYFCSKNDTTIYRRTIVIAVPQHTHVTEFTSETVPENVYLVSDIDNLNKVVLVNSVNYRTDYLRTVLDFSTPLRHCLYNTVFDYADASDTVTDGKTVYQLYPIHMYSFDGHAFFTQKEPYSATYSSFDNSVCGFKHGIKSFWDDTVELCLGVNPNKATQSVDIGSVYSKNIIDSVYGDMLNIYDCPSPVNADIKLSIYSEQDSPNEMYLQRGVRLDIDCYTACASQFGFIFVNDITNEIYEPAMRDGIVEGYKELVYKPVKFRLLSNKNSDNQLRTVPPVADVQISNEQEYYTVGVSVIGRWQVRKYSVNDLEHPELVEDFGARTEILDAYLEADGDFDYFAGDEHVSLVTSGTPWLVVIRASDKHMYVKKVGDSVSTAVLLDTDVEQASMCRGWKSDKYDVDSGLIVAYRKATGVFMRSYYKINDVYTWDSVQILSSFKATKVEVKRLNDFRIGIFSYSQSNQNQVWLSPRYYIGGTSKTEYLTPRVNYDFLVFSATAENGPHDDLVITSVELRNGIEFWIQGNYPFVWRDTSWTNEVSITSNPPADYAIDNYRVDSGYFVIRMTKAFTSPYIYITFRLNSLNRIRFKRTDQSMPICPQLDIVYDNPARLYNTETMSVAVSNVTCSFVTKQMMIYSGYHTETLQPSITAEATFTTKEMVTHSGYTTETLRPTITNVTCTFTVEQSGDTPV